MTGDSIQTNASGLTFFARFTACCLIIALWYIFGSGLNDYVDYEIDKINLPDATDRPLLSGQADKPALLRVSLLAGSFTLPLAFLLSIQHLALVVSLLALSVGYSIPPLAISRRGGLAPLLLPMGYILLPFVLGIMLTTTAIGMWPIPILIASYYFHFISRIILKDYRDTKGDKANGKMTYLLRHGNQSVCLVSAISLTISTLLLMIGLHAFIGVFKFGFVFLLFFGLVTLQQISQANNWTKQKPILAAFGRAMTGITALTIITLCNAIWHFSFIAQVVLLIALIGVYVWSAQQANRYSATKKPGATALK